MDNLISILRPILPIRIIPLPRLSLHIQIRTLFKLIWQFQLFGIFLLGTLRLVICLKILFLLTYTSFKAFAANEAHLFLHIAVKHRQ